MSLNNILSPEIANFYSSINLEMPANLLDLCSEKRKEKIGTLFWEQTVNDINKIVVNKSQWNLENNSEVSIISELSSQSHYLAVENLFMNLRPWRKGPWEINNTFIDAEWRSELKWNRLSKNLPDLRNKIVLDVGCNNGYYMYRAKSCGAKAVLGIDPNDRFGLQFLLTKKLSGEPSLFFEYLGVEDVLLFNPIFDLVFCLGVIYHRKDPLGMIAQLKSITKPGGHVVLESITLPGGKDEVKYIHDRYCQMRNVYFLPSSEVLADWMRRCGFKDVKIIDISSTTTEEQRKTTFGHFDSLSEFLDPIDISKTVEGYPSPQRTTVIGTVA
jgi:tRNA (mo5U34)-methyltransferase